jgi:hypothetical protein
MAVCVCITYWHSAFTKWVYFLYDLYGVSRQPLLVDMGFRALGHWDDAIYGRVPEVLAFGLIAAACVFCLAALVSRQHYRAVHVLRRFLSEHPDAAATG